tara:strand:- start:69424 stop:70434 length:1011 start_codon:yes stop_codon:yes gene_type:complete
MAKRAAQAWDLRQLQIYISKNRPKGVFFVVGEETYLVDESLRVLKEKFIEHVPTIDFNFDQVYAHDVKGESVADLVDTLPMMADQRMVLVRGAQSWKESDWSKLASVLETPQESCLFVIEMEKIDRRKKWVKNLGKSIQWVELKPPYDNQIPQWIQYISSELDLKLSHGQVQWVQQCVGQRLVDIKNELLKLKQFIGEETIVSDEDLRRVVSATKTQSVFELTDAIASNQKGEALQALNKLIDQGQNEVGIVHMVARHFRMLRKTLSLKGKGLGADQLAKELGVHKFFVSKYIQQSQKWSQGRLDQATSHLYEVDGNLKSSSLRGQLFLENLILSI